MQALGTSFNLHKHWLWLTVLHMVQCFGLCFSLISMSFQIFVVFSQHLSFLRSNLFGNILNAGGCTFHVDTSFNSGNSLPQICNVRSRMHTSSIYCSTFKMKVAHAAIACAHGYRSVWNLSHSNHLFWRSTS